MIGGYPCGSGVPSLSLTPSVWLSVLPDVSSGWQLLHRLKVGLLPFLRAAALFFHYLNSSVPPTDLMGECSSAGVSRCVCEVFCDRLCGGGRVRSRSVGGALQLPQSALQPAAALPKPSLTAGPANTQVTREPHTPNDALWTQVERGVCVATGGVTIRP